VEQWEALGACHMGEAVRSLGGWTPRERGQGEPVPWAKHSSCAWQESCSGSPR